MIFQVETCFGSRLLRIEEKLAMTQQKDGEQLQSMFFLYGTYAFLIITSWGVLGQKWMVVLSVVALYHNHTSLTNMGHVVAVCAGIALISAVAELFSKNGMDTVICPCVAMTGFMILKFVAGVIWNMPVKANCPLSLQH